MYLTDRELSNMRREEYEIRNIFGRTYKGKPNCLTPGYYRFGKAGQYLYELSVGKFMKSTLFGVTVLTPTGEKTELSECFSDEDRSKALVAAEEYIKKLASLDNPESSSIEDHGTDKRTDSQRPDDPSQRNHLVAPSKSQAAHLGSEPSPVSDTLGS